MQQRPSPHDHPEDAAAPETPSDAATEPATDDSEDHSGATRGPSDDGTIPSDAAVESSTSAQETDSEASDAPADAESPSPPVTAVPDAVTPDEDATPATAAPDDDATSTDAQKQEASAETPASQEESSATEESVVESDAGAATPSDDVAANESAAQSEAIATDDATAAASRSASSATSAEPDDATVSAATKELQAPGKPPAVWYMPEPGDRPLPWLSWRYSLIFLVALIGVIATAAYAYVTRTDDAPQELVFRVVDANQTPISGATIQLGTSTRTTDAEGIAHLPQGTGSQTIHVERAGFNAVEGTVDPTDGDRLEIVLQPAPAATPAMVGTPASPPATVAAAATPTAVTTADDATPGALLPKTNTTHGLLAREIAGQVRDPNGAPIQGARVSAGAVWSITGADGIYSLQRANIDIHQPVHVFASGYADAQITIPPLGNAFDVTLQPIAIKAIYLNPTVTTTQDEIDAMIAIANTTEINAIVIDIKEELVFYDTQVPLFREAGTVDPILDLPNLLNEFHKYGIYTIARLVVFKDSYVAEQRPDLAINSTVTRVAWRDQNGVAWVNPMKQELWEANTALAVEAANLGFDEIQFDYVRFPTDGDLSTMDFGAANNEANREQTITGFVEYAWQRLIPTGAKLSADVFGYTLMVQDDLWIGQNLNLLAPHLDYLSPMVYPSHYGERFQEWAPPVNYPYEVVSTSLQTGVATHQFPARQLRPWLQDFDYSANDIHYGAKEVRAQIDAAEASGTSGWMLWSLGNPITVDALKPESGHTPDAPQPALLLAVLGGVAYDPRQRSAA